MIRSAALAGFVIAAGFAATAPASAQAPDAGARLMIVNGNTGRVIYDDGRNDLFCVTRVVRVGWNQWTGRPILRRTMRCR